MKWPFSKSTPEKPAESIRTVAPFPIVDAPAAPDWSESDREALSQFLRTAAGEKIRALANWHEQATNRSAVLRGNGFEHNCGFASGWHHASRFFLHTLSAPQTRDPQGDDAEPATDAERLRERLAS